MAIIKTVTASGSYVVSPNTTATTYTPAVEAVVSDGKLVPSDRVAKPGVFTQGTATEGTASFSQYSSNA